MCRFIAYLGEQPVTVASLIDEPKNSLIKQSHGSLESKINIHGDGFGISWYSNRCQPGIFKSIRPAWNDQNLIYLANELSSSCFMAHIRAATHGDVCRNNCHPFHYEKYSFMHNGRIDGFSEIKRELSTLLDDDLFLHISGSTDSEHLFFLIMHFLKAENDLIQAIESAFSWIESRLTAKGHIAHLNIAITDGAQMIATRYSTHNQEPLSLYQSTSMHKDGFIISSEALHDCAKTWTKVPNGHYVYMKEMRGQAIIAPLEI